MAVKLNEPFVLVKATRAPVVTNPNPSLGPVRVAPTPSLKDTSFSDSPENRKHGGHRHPAKPENISVTVDDAPADGTCPDGSDDGGDPTSCDEEQNSKNKLLVWN